MAATLKAAAWLTALNAFILGGVAQDPALHEDAFAKIRGMALEVLPLLKKLSGSYVKNAQQQGRH